VKGSDSIKGEKLIMRIMRLLNQRVDPLAKYGKSSDVQDVQDAGSLAHDSPSVLVCPSLMTKTVFGDPPAIACDATRGTVSNWYSISAVRHISSLIDNI
jgi:hypothetical protein